MKSRDVLGRKIVGIEQAQWFNHQIGRRVNTVGAIILDDGTRLIPMAYESVDEPYADVLVVKPKRKPKGGAA